MEYRIMIHPAGEVRQVLKPQLARIAWDVYGRKTEDVIFKVKRLPEYTNRRKLFFPGNGEVVDLEAFPHITLSQKIEMDEDQEHVLEEKVKRIAAFSPFIMQSSYVGDYGEDFTIYLAFEDSKEASRLKGMITTEFGEYFSKDKEKRDVLHTTLVYDDNNVGNIRKAWSLVDKDRLVGRKLPVSSIWVWRGLTPYKEFKFT